MEFIVIEGLDGSGKSTVTKRLAAHFAGHNLPCHHTFEPTNNKIGTFIRSILSGAQQTISSEAMALLFAADRKEHIANELLPKLEKGSVVSDRYYLSNMAYQGFDDVHLEKVIAYNQAAMETCKPHITFFLNVSPQECMRRVESRGEGKSIYETLANLEHIHQRYQAAIVRMKATDNIIFVGSDTATTEAIVDEMWGHIMGLRK